MFCELGDDAEGLGNGAGVVEGVFEGNLATSSRVLR